MQWLTIIFLKILLNSSIMQSILYYNGQDIFDNMKKTHIILSDEIVRQHCP